MVCVVATVAISSNIYEEREQRGQQVWHCPCCAGQNKTGPTDKPFYSYILRQKRLLFLDFVSYSSQLAALHNSPPCQQAPFETMTIIIFYQRGCYLLHIFDCMYARRYRGGQRFQGYACNDSISIIMSKKGIDKMPRFRWLKGDSWSKLTCYIVCHYVSTN